MGRFLIWILAIDGAMVAAVLTAVVAARRWKRDTGKRPSIEK